MADRKTYYRKQGSSGTRQTYYAPSSSSSKRETYFGHTSTGPHHSHNPLDFVANAAHEVEGMAVGALPGVYNMARHPVRSAKGIYELEKENYAPLLHGDFKKFAQQVYEHPVGYALDAATLAAIIGTAGLASPEAVAARTSLEAGEATKGIQLSNAARMAGQEGGRTIVKRTSRNPVIRARQHAVDRMLKRLPADTKVVGEHARYGRATRRETYHEARRVRVLGYPFETAMHRLSKIERIAWSYHHDAIHPTEEAAFLKHEHPDWETNEELAGVKAAIKRGEDPKIIAAYEHPSKALQKAIDEGRRLSDKLTEERIGGVDSAFAGSFEDRPWLHLRMTKGAQFVKLHAERPSLARARSRVKALQKAYDKAVASTMSAQHKMVANLAAKIGRATEDTPATTVIRPRTVGEARSRFASLDKQYQAFITEVTKKVGHPDEGNKAVSSMRSAQRSRYKKQQSGKNKAGKNSGAAGTDKIQRLVPTVTQEKRLMAERYVQELIAKSPEHSGLAQLAKIIGERDRLQELLSKHDEGMFGEAGETFDFGEIEAKVPAQKGKPGVGTIAGKVITPGRVLTPKGGVKSQHLGTLLSDAKGKLERMESAAQRRYGYVPKPGDKEQMVLWGGPSIDALKAEGRTPFYVPDIVSKTKRPRAGTPQGIGRGVPAKEHALRQNLGRVFEDGLLYRDPQALHIGHLRQVRSILAHSIHDALVENAVKVAKDAHVPSTYIFIRAEAKDKIGHLAQVQGRAVESLKDFSEPFDFLTHTAEEALEDGQGHYLVVPKAYADKLTGEFSKSDNAFRAIWERPTKIWRAMVLGLRPGFFTNNAVGNYLLYALRHHGWASVEAWLSFLKETGQRKALHTLEHDPTFKQLAMHHIPEVFYGTFGRSQFEDLPAIGKFGRLRHGVGPATVTVAEETPRLMIARETVIKEARSLKLKVPRQTRKFNALADEMLRRPGVAERAVDEANRTLGDYLHYAPAEQQLRNLIPFYGWIRAITRIALLTALDTPWHADLVASLGKLAIQENESKFGPLPDYLVGMIPLSGVENGSVTALTTKGLNPASTIADVSKGLHGIATGQRGEGAAALAALGPTPFLQAMYEWASGKSMRFGNNVDPALVPGAAGYMLGSVGSQLPQVNLLNVMRGHPRKSTVYENNASRKAAISAISGFPVKRINLAAANKSAGLQNR